MQPHPGDDVEGLAVDVDGRVLVLRLDRPEVHNAFSGRVVAALLSWLRWAGSDATIGAVVIHGTDPSFSSGADTRDMDSGQLDLRRAPSLPDALRDCRVPTICAVNGPAFGGGATVPLAADLRIASPRASLSFHFSRAGLVPEGGATATLQRIVGRGQALDIFLAARTIDAHEGARLGLFDRLVPRHEDLMPTTMDWANELAQAPAGMAAVVKDLLSSAETLPFPMQRKLERRAFAESVRARLRDGGSIRSAE